jgi:hypothetical protein
LLRRFRAEMFFARDMPTHPKKNGALRVFIHCYPQTGQYFGFLPDCLYDP